MSSDLDVSHIIRPKLPYHKRWEIYVRKRDEIFNVSTLCQNVPLKTNRSTSRIRRFYKVRKHCHRFLVSAIISDPKDLRYYSKVSFLEFEELGLLDTGANVSCIGSELALTDFSQYSWYTKCKFNVKMESYNLFVAGLMSRFSLGTNVNESHCL